MTAASKHNYAWNETDERTLSEAFLKYSHKVNSVQESNQPVQWMWRLIARKLIFCHYLSVLVITHYLSLFFIICHYWSLLVIIGHYFSLFFIIFHYLSLLVIIGNYWSLLVIICLYLSLFVFICHYLSLFVSLSVWLLMSVKPAVHSWCNLVTPTESKQIQLFLHSKNLAFRRLSSFPKSLTFCTS